MNSMQVDILEIYFTKAIKERRSVTSLVGGKEVDIPWLMWIELVRDGFLNLEGNTWDILFIRENNDPLTPYKVGLKPQGYMEENTGYPGFWVPGTEVHLYWCIGSMDLKDPESVVVKELIR